MARKDNLSKQTLKSWTLPEQSGKQLAKKLQSFGLVDFDDKTDG